MGPKAKFTKEQIIDAAFEIARQEGLDNITIRKVAEKLGSSVAPIYVNFKDAGELIEAVVAKIFGITHQLLAEQNTGNPFQDIAMASIKFAKEYSVLFRDMVLKENQHMQNYDKEVGSVLIEEMKKDSDLKEFNEEELKSILLKMRIFQLGLSVMVANGMLPKEYSDEQYMEFLNSAATDVVIGTKFRKEEKK